MEIKAAFATNSRPAYVAQPVFGEDGSICQLDLDPVVAWRIEYDEEETIDDHPTCVALPITTAICGLPKTWATYYSDTEGWSIQDDTSGEGLESLLERFRRIEQEDGG